MARPLLLALAEPDEVAVKQPLHITAENVPTEGAERARRRGIELLAEGLADLAIADARAELAAELGLDADALDHSRSTGLTDEARAAADLPLRARGAR